MEPKQEIKPEKNAQARKTTLVLGKVLLSILLFTLTGMLIVQVPPVQQWAKGKVVHWLENKFKAPVSVGRVAIIYPNLISLNNVFIADNRKDTLLYGGYLGVDLQIGKLLFGEVVINEIRLKDIQAQIQTDSAGSSNYAHIIEAFASDNPSPTVTPETESPVKISLSGIKLDRVRVRYEDNKGGLIGNFVINQLRAKCDSIDFNGQRFKLSSLDLNGGKVSIKMWDMPKAVSLPNNTGQTRLPDIFIGKAALSEIEFEYTYKDGGMDMDANIGAYDAHNLNLLLNAQMIDLGNSNLKNTSYNFRAGNAAQVDTSSSAKTPNWIIVSNNIGLTNGKFSYQDLTSKPVKRGMDYSNLFFSNINLIGKSLYVSGGDTVSANIEAGSLLEKSGLKVNSIKTGLLYTAHGVRLNNLALTTPGSRIEKDLEIGYESPSQVAENPGELWMKGDFKNTKIAHRDLLTVAPILYNYPMFSDLPNATMEVDGKVTGFLKNLKLDNVSFKGFGETSFKASGTITGLPDPYNIGTNLQITRFSTSSGNLKKIIPEGLIPPEIELPPKISMTGTIKGDFQKKLEVNTIIQSSLGGLSAKGYILNPADSKNASYDLTGRFTGFNMGRFFNQKDLGLLSMRFKLKGKGYDPSLISGMYNLNVESIGYGGFTYKNIDLEAQADQGAIHAQISSADTIHAFNLSLFANLRGDYPMLNSSIDLQALDLQKLGYSEAPLTLSANAEIDFPRLDPHNPVGYFNITDVQGVYDTVHFRFDTLNVISSYAGGIQRLRLNSNFATADIKGAFSVSALFPEIINFVNLYYVVAKPVPALRGDQQAEISLTLRPSSQMESLFPSMVLKNNLEAKLSFDSRNCLFDLSGILPQITMGDQSITGGSYFVEAEDSALGYKIFVDDYQSSIYHVPTILLQGDIIQRLIYSDVRLLDDFGRLQHTLITFIEQKDSGYAVHIDPTSVTLNYEPWGLNPDNELFFTEKGIIANSFTFSNGAQALVLQTYGENLNDPIGIRLFNFKISTFTSIARQDSLYLDGTLNGYAEVQLQTAHPVFFADLTVDGLTFKADTVGNIKIKASNEKEGIYVLDAAMTGNDNEISLAGNYNLSQDEFDLQFDVEKLTMQTLEPFAMGYMNRMKGHIEGGISVTGNRSDPDVVGNLLFRDAEGNVPLLNSVFSLKNERIRFLPDGIYFNEFTLTDQNQKKAILDGNIKTKDWLHYVFNLGFEANNFRVVNSTRRDNKLFYGTLFLDTKINIKGNTDRPVIAAAFKANRNTDLTMVLPQNDPEAAEREGIVEFFDEDLPDADSLFAQMVDSLSQSSVKGISLNANFEIDPSAKLSFVIDEANGDMLVAKGTANLSTSIDPSGKVSVTGTYELDEGSYSMSMKLLKFDFTIEKGSTITWTGEPTDADINVTAIYKVKTAPYDLVEQQITGESDETKAKYKDRIPFNVKLIIKGQLLKPEISFDIGIAETSGTSSEVVSTVNSKLDNLRIDQSQMNQQVFALILLGSFIPDNPFASSSSGGSTSTLARQSVSKLLTSQLNQLAGSLITGVDIDIGIDSDEDYSTGTGEKRTDLNVALSKKLLKDRLKITVGSNFELEGSSRPNEKTSNIAGDIKADYSLSRDGRYVLRAYRVDQYEVALQGQVVETGVTFIININFNTFKEIFEKKKKQTITP